MSSVPCYHRLEDVYDNVGEIQSRFTELNNLFEEKYHCKPDFYVRAPGRVNLIGEHIDYHGYSVFPMAIVNDMIIAVSSEENTSGATEFSVHNVNPKFASSTLPVDPKAPMSPEHNWSLYFQCGYKGAFDHFDTAHNPPRLLKIAMSGTVPPAAGVSSSSAFVVASCMATALANGMAFDKSSLAEACRVAEFYIGTMGGGMDQAISVHGIRGYASHIEFNPLKATPVQLPAGGVFVISNSFYQAPKAVTAATGYNLRVVEGRLAAKLIAKAFGLPRFLEYVTLRELQHDLGDKTLEEMQAIVKETLHETPYTTAEIEAELGELTQPRLFADRPAAAKVLEVNSSFKCQQRALHVLSEADRVLKFRAVCEDELPRKLERLGELMNESHASCDGLYECSCEQLNELVEIARSMWMMGMMRRRHGAIGSRLTGAGWGGCAVHLVKEEALEEFMKALREEYYVKHGFDEEQIKQGLFASKPGAGACYFEGIEF
ncbi:uncharacterized protein [Blastocystis hominis]|uniref:Galactokinase n=1 Tax=Blastocystis hominis TaxID=12968 RepID=D8M8X7_BLAHO|nr:uncharacterized protein [Blastocystis hominis]CBK24516.2 unnamed protein product [Blastocystis hominis]|eukprot:XP_012898564.1 uncharacterized protein [Blastocystis hominis]